MARKSKDYNMYRELDIGVEEMRRQLPKLARVANQRLKELEKRGEKRFAYAKAMEFLGEGGRFSYSTRQTARETRAEFNALLDFLTAKSSTYTGLQEVFENARVRLESQLREKFKDRYTEKQLKDPEFRIIRNWKAFEDFLKSSEFKKISKYVDSDQVMEDFNEAINEGEEYDEILKAYREFNDSEMTFEQIAEQRKKKRLLK